MTILSLEKVLTFKKMPIECKTYSSNAHIPTRAYPGSAGYDLLAAETKVLRAWSRELIRLDLLMAIPKGYYGRIVCRSGLANTHGITVHDGTIDLDYRGKVCVALFNLSDEEYVVETGKCVAQLIIEHCFTPKFVEVGEFTEEKTERGQKGFDSLGVSFFFFFIFFSIKS